MLQQEEANRESMERSSEIFSEKFCKFPGNFQQTCQVIAPYIPSTEMFSESAKFPKENSKNVRLSSIFSGALSHCITFPHTYYIFYPYHHHTYFILWLISTK